MQQAAFAPVAREMAPRGYSALRSLSWPEHPDFAAILQSQLSNWLQNVTEADELFRRHVYDNKDIQESDLRQHRMMLYAILCDGEQIAFEYMKLGASDKAKESEHAIGLVDQKLKSLFDVLISWHGGLALQRDIPDSFKQSIQQMEEGNIVDFKEP